MSKLDTSKTLYIMGNGPSLGKIMNDPSKLNILRENHTFGLNAAYRAYEKYNIYPTYFGCFDYIVNESHKDAFERLVLENNPIKKFWFIGSREKKQHLYSEIVRNNEKFVKFNFKTSHPDSYPGISTSFDDYHDPGSSGANALHIGIMLGYKKIILIGCDCNYVEEIDGIEKSERGVTLTKNLDSNPNYWFSEYQQKGDKFNKPSCDVWQYLSWKNMHMYKPDDVSIINGSMASKITFFVKAQV